MEPLKFQIATLSVWEPTVMLSYLNTVRSVWEMHAANLNSCTRPPHSIGKCFSWLPFDDQKQGFSSKCDDCILNFLVSDNELYPKRKESDVPRGQVGENWDRISDRNWGRRRMKGKEYEDGKLKRVKKKYFPFSFPFFHFCVMTDLMTLNPTLSRSPGEKC